MSYNKSTFLRPYSTGDVAIFIQDTTNTVTYEIAPYSVSTTYVNGRYLRIKLSGSTSMIALDFGTVGDATDANVAFNDRVAYMKTQIDNPCTSCGGNCGGNCNGGSGSGNGGGSTSCAICITNVIQQGANYQLVLSNGLTVTIDNSAISSNLHNNGNGSYTLTIGNQQVTWYDGADGNDGTSPSYNLVTNPNGSYSLTIGNQTVTWRDGVDGNSSIVLMDNGDGTYTMVGDSQTVTWHDGLNPVLTTNPNGSFTMTAPAGNSVTWSNGKSVSVVDNGNGTYTLTDGFNNQVILRDGKTPTIVQNGNNTYTITDGFGNSATLYNGQAPTTNLTSNGQGDYTLTVNNQSVTWHDGEAPVIETQQLPDGSWLVEINGENIILQNGEDGVTPQVSLVNNGNNTFTFTVNGQSVTWAGGANTSIVESGNGLITLTDSFGNTVSWTSGEDVVLPPMPVVPQVSMSTNNQGTYILTINGLTVQFYDTNRSEQNDDDNQLASQVLYNNSFTLLSSNTVQSAIDELKSLYDSVRNQLNINNSLYLNDDQISAEVSYNNTNSQLTAHNVQAAIDEIMALINNLPTSGSGSGCGCSGNCNCNGNCNGNCNSCNSCGGEITLIDNGDTITIKDNDACVQYTVPKAPDKFGSVTEQPDGTFVITDWKNDSVTVLPANLAADKTFSFAQMTASDTWTINHNLNKYSSVQVSDLSRQEIGGIVQWISPNQVKILFNIPVSGYAYFN